MTPRIVEHLVIAAAFAAAIQSHGAEQPGEVDSLTCHRGAKFVVVERVVENGVGTDFLIKPTREYRTDPCKYKKEHDDFEIKNRFAEYFLGLRGNLLLLDSGTGPERGLIIWDIAARKIVLSVPYAEPLTLENDVLRFWSETGEANADHCPKLNEWKTQGLGAALETLITLRLPDVTPIFSAEKRCSPRQ